MDWAAGRIDARTLQIGVLVAIIEYVTMALNNVQQLSTLFIIPTFTSFLETYWGNIKFRRKSGKVYKNNFDMNEISKEGISFKNMSFYYPNSNLPAVEDFNTLFEK